MYKDFIKKNYKILLDILNCLKVGVYITDGDGNTVFLNDESCKTGGLTREEVLGKCAQTATSRRLSCSGICCANRMKTMKR